ncbi:MAG: hypothetical protein GF417_01150 [Candidatus Latescibacteria bacterium]|nr:hypothetical protein [bacterium]MBD3423034.1 hypothetical protein [Candidatus Latescibacterota bacterium]
MRIKVLLMIVMVMAPGPAYALGNREDRIDTHIGAGVSLYAPFHIRTISEGYNLYLVMRPSYSRYMYDELEKFNLGMVINSSSQKIKDQYSFTDVVFLLRYYFNRKMGGSGWQSGFIGAGAGIASVNWEWAGVERKKKDAEYMLEAGYELDLCKNYDWFPFVLMFTMQYRIIDIKPVSYTGTGFALSISYGVLE